MGFQVTLPWKVICMIVDFKSHYNKTKISEMDISDIYLKNESFEIFA